MKFAPFASTTALLCAFAALMPATLRAQDANPPAAPAPQASPGQPVITPEQREKLKAAYGKAIQDPKVAETQKNVISVWGDYRALVKKKVLAMDASMGPLLDKSDKVAQALAENKTPDRLTLDEQKALHDAFQKVEADPEVKDATAKLDDAKKAKEAALRAAILQADPSLEPLLAAIDKLNKPSPSPSPAK